jgi:pimeloyl-ACP methyl ester carboxylesterase
MNAAPSQISAMAHVTAPSGIRVSFERSGTGPPLVLVHGGFSDHLTNWELVQPLWRHRFRVYAVARRGRGTTDATQGHSVEDEARDVAAVIRQVGEPVALLGHSYGALVSLAAARLVPDRLRRLVLYEPPSPLAFTPRHLAHFEVLAKARQWEMFAETFFLNGLHVPRVELDAVRRTDGWAPIVADARATLEDLRALSRFRFEREAFRDLRVPVMLQIGSESRHELYLTDDLAEVLPDVRIRVLTGQAHEGMTTAPEQYAAAVTKFLLP